MQGYIVYLNYTKPHKMTEIVTEFNTQAAHDPEDFIVSTTTDRVIVYQMLAVIGIVGNLLVVSIFITSKTLRQKQTIMYIINPSLLDFTACLILMAADYLNETRIQAVGRAYSW